MRWAKEVLEIKELFNQINIRWTAHHRRGLVESIPDLYASDATDGCFFAWGEIIFAGSCK